MNGLAWNYIEPTPIESSGLVASNIQNAQQGLANGLAAFRKVGDNFVANETAKQNQELLGLYNSLATSSPNVQPSSNGVDTNNPASVNTPNTYAFPDVPLDERGLVNKTIPQSTNTPVQSGNGLVRPPVDAAKPYMGMIEQAANTYGVPQDVLLAVAQTESGFKPDAKSATGVRGLMQVTQDTYRGLGFTGDRADPTNSINAGAKLLNQLYKQYGNWDDALAAYNGGADGVRGMRTGNWGIWSSNPNKQREISRYASTVNNYRTAWNR